MSFKIIDVAGSSVIPKGGVKFVHDDNFIDRLSHRYTVLFILFAQMLVLTTRYVGDPIHCWCPTEFTKNEVIYTNYVCWVHNTYYIPFSEPIPSKYEMRKTNEITYYQWVPLILLAMAFCLKMPRWAWKYFAYTSSGVDLKKIVENAKDTQNITTEEREKKLNMAATYIDIWLHMSQQHRAGVMAGARERVAYYCSVGIGRHYGNFLISLCVVTKALYFINAIVILYFLNEFLGSDKFYVYGYEVVNSFLSGNDWSRSVRFPRVTICDFDLRQLSNVQRFSVQCVLPVNLYNEKIFVCLWFWLTIIACASFINFLHRVVITCLPHYRRNFVKKYMKMNYLYDNKDKDDFSVRLTNDFIHSYLKQDGIYLLNLISDNTNTVMVSEIVNNLWKIFRKRRFQIKSSKHLHTIHPQGSPVNGRISPITGKITEMKDEMDEFRKESSV